MDSFSAAFYKLCRICLSADNTNLVSLFNADNTLNNYGHSVNTFSSIFITYNPDLPSKMCTKCLKLLYNASFFKLRCERTQTTLSKLSKSDQAKKKIVQYAFYSKFLLKNSKNDTKMDTSSNLESQCSDDNAGPSEQNNHDNVSISSEDSDKQLSLFKKETKNVIKKEPSSVKREKYENSVKEEREPKRKEKLTGRRVYTIQDRTCDICKKVFANRFSKEAHRPRHFKSSHVCEQCGNCFASKTELRIHLFVKHKTGRGYSCEKCDFTAAKRFELIEHDRIHTGERPFACETCGKTFRRRYIYMKHLVVHNEKKYQCGKCPSKFVRRSSVLAHHNSVHERLYMFACQYCGANYAKISTVRKHIFDRHGVSRADQGKITRVQVSTNTYTPYIVLDTPNSTENTVEQNSNVPVTEMT